MEAPFKGQCECGNISYFCTSEPKFTLMCQCRQCQRISGAGHSAQLGVSLEDLDITGDISAYELKSDAGNTVISAFCGKCGNPVYKTTSSSPNHILLHAATLDDPGQFKPEMVVYEKGAQPWDKIDKAIPRR